MANVSGTLFFDVARSNSSTGLPGIAGVPIVLENTTNSLRLSVRTDSNGAYNFTNVPNGIYQIVEAYGDAGPISTTGNFGAEAALGPFAVATTPPISYILTLAIGTSLPVGTTDLDCISRNTIPLTVSGTNITGQNISNGPVKYDPIIVDSSVYVNLENNLIVVADSGTFGLFTAGTAEMTGSSPNPYPSVNLGFTYVLPAANTASPSDGEYSIQNIANNVSYQLSGSWWRIADHTTGNETGRMMIVNGANTGETFFYDVVTVQPDTYYLFTTRILNLIKITGRVNPQLGVIINSTDGEVLIDESLGEMIPANLVVPEWREFGRLVYSGDNTQLEVQFLSLGAAASGNDYAIDDVAFYEVDINYIEVVKSASTTIATIGESIYFSFALTNTTDSNITNLFLSDPLPNEIVFIEGSLEINGVNFDTYDPNTGFSMADLASGDSIIVTFGATVASIPVGGTLTNTGSFTYDAVLVQGIPPTTFSSSSNSVDILLIYKADVYIFKTGDSTVQNGNNIVYTLTVGNNGPNSAENVIVTDNLPSEITSANYSMDNGTTWQTWTGSCTILELQSGQSITILIEGLVNGKSGTEITNVASVLSSSWDPDQTNNESSFTIILETVPNDTVNADTFINLSTQTSQIQNWSTLVYQITYGNYGPDTAVNTTLSVTTFGLTNPQYSLDGGFTWQTWTGSLSLGDLQLNQTGNLMIRANVNAITESNITNTATIESITPDLNINNNVSTVSTTVIKPSIYTKEDVINQILVSISMESLAISRILNAEGEKIQHVLGTLRKLDDD